MLNYTSIGRCINFYLLKMAYQGVQHTQKTKILKYISVTVGKWSVQWWLQPRNRRHTCFLIPRTWSQRLIREWQWGNIYIFFSLCRFWWASTSCLSTVDKNDLKTEPPSASTILAQHKCTFTWEIKLAEIHIYSSIFNLFCRKLEKKICMEEVLRESLVT